MSSPNFQTLPRITCTSLGSVMTPLMARSGRGRGACKVDEGLRVAHAAKEVAVGRREADLAVAEDAAVHAAAGGAARAA